MLRHHPKRSISILAATGLVALAFLASASLAAGPKVTITGDSPTSYAFAPKTVEVNAGSTVHWSWDSNAPHNVTFSKLGKHSDTGASESYKLKFNKPGTYKYECTVHDFKGKIIVN